MEKKNASIFCAFQNHLAKQIDKKIEQEESQLGLVKYEILE
tara:strand:+ start:367 stop:489 length:123 start_codon:yes stop_codon:yes gene_type:complete